MSFYALFKGSGYSNSVLPLLSTLAISYLLLRNHKPRKKEKEIEYRYIDGKIIVVNKDERN